jgi:adenylate cyclase
VAAIEANGWTVWWDREIFTGQEFDRQIAAELKIATAVLVVWTPISVESRWVRGEAREGAERGILVPVRFERADLPIDVRTLHTTDFDDWREDPRSPEAQEVMRALGAMIARQRVRQAAPAVAGPARVAICVLPFGACESRLSWSTGRAMITSGPNVTIASSTTSSRCRMKSPRQSSRL